MASDYRDGVRYTGLVDRLPDQSVLALAILALPVVAALGALPFRLPTWAAAFAGSPGCESWRTVSCVVVAGEAGVVPRDQTRDQDVAGRRERPGMDEARGVQWWETSNVEGDEGRRLRRRFGCS